MATEDSSSPSIPVTVKSVMASACGDALLEVFGEKTCTAVEWHLKELGVDWRECFSEPETFHKALVNIFKRPGAALIERRILQKFYRKVGFAWNGEEPDFVAEVRKIAVSYKTAPP